jgi:hypothetical protein
VGLLDGGFEVGEVVAGDPEVFGVEGEQEAVDLGGPVLSVLLGDTGDRFRGADIEDAGGVVGLVEGGFVGEECAGVLAEAAFFFGGAMDGGYAREEGVAGEVGAQDEGGLIDAGGSTLEGGGAQDCVERLDRDW